MPLSNKESAEHTVNIYKCKFHNILLDGDDLSATFASIWPWVGEGGGVEVLIFCLSNSRYSTPEIDLNKVGTCSKSRRFSSSFLAELRSSRGETSSSDAVSAKTRPNEQWSLL